MLWRVTAVEIDAPTWSTNKTCDVSWLAWAAPCLLRARRPRHNADVPTEMDQDAFRAVEEVDRSLLELFLAMTLTERLRAASKSAATLARLRDAASTNR